MNMNVNKKLDRFKQWAKEGMGEKAKTDTTDDFKALEMEMNLRHEGMDRLQKSMTTYMKAMSRREMDDREKLLPVGILGNTMVTHGQDFQHDSEFGQCLISMGRANEAVARKQEGYIVNATTSWMESLDRSLVQMKEYQNARKKLDTRRLAYDASLAKMQKAKKEDFRIEEELRAQKAKYEESSEDVYRRMMEIKEAEVDSVADLTAFVDAELAYYDSCRDILLQLKRDWPASANVDTRRPTRPRSNTAQSFTDRFSRVEEESKPEPKVMIPSRLSSRNGSPRRDFSDSPREYAPAPMPRLTRVPTEPSAILANRSQLRPVKRTDSNANIFDDDSSVHDSSSPDRYYGDRAESPTTSFGSTVSRTTSWSNVESGSTLGSRKAPPPPPPSRSKKPPPPPPMKRSALSTSEIPHA